MDYVNRFENRTVWGQGDDLKAKFGATTVFIRARPPGFGLQVPHILHRVFSACGIRDASATIEGSRNPMNVVQAAIQILHGGVSRWISLGLVGSGSDC
jgi:small subunit ribosomal protein S5